MEVWAPALATGKGILSPAFQQQRLAGMVTAGPGVTYGLGLFEITGFLGHDGEVPGYDSVALYQPASKTTVIVLGNLSPLLSTPPQSSLETFPNVATALVQAIS